MDCFGFPHLLIKYKEKILIYNLKPQNDATKFLNKHYFPIIFLCIKENCKTTSSTKKFHSILVFIHTVYLITLFAIMVSNIYIILCFLMVYIFFFGTGVVAEPDELEGCEDMRFFSRSKF